MPITGLEVITDAEIEQMRCVPFVCLVDMGEIVEKKGSIILTDGNVEREVTNRIKGKLVKLGDGSFPEMKDKPEVGDTVILAKYSGLALSGEGDKLYRLVNDVDVKTFTKGLGKIISNARNWWLSDQFEELLRDDKFLSWQKENLMKHGVSLEGDVPENWEYTDQEKTIFKQRWQSSMI